jgi:hypothetical protein
MFVQDRTGVCEPGKLSHIEPREREHAMHVYVGKLHAGLMGKRTWPLPIGTRTIATRRTRAIACTMKKRQIRMCVTDPTTVAGTRERLHSNHTGPM